MWMMHPRPGRTSIDRCPFRWAAGDALSPMPLCYTVHHLRRPAPKKLQQSTLHSIFSPIFFTSASIDQGQPPGACDEEEAMKILESPLMGEFIGFLKSNWGGHSRVSQRRRRLQQLVAMVRSVADAAEGRTAVRGSSLDAWLRLLRKEALGGQAVLDATSDPSAVVGSAKKFLAGVKALFVCSAEVDRLTDAVDALERLAGPGADLDIFLKVLQLDNAAAMDLDDDDATAFAFAPAHYVEDGSYSYSVATAPGAKRKRSGSSGVEQAGDCGNEDGEAASHGRVLVDRAYRHKRRALAYKRHTSSGPLLSAGPDRSVAVAMAMARVRRRIGRPSLGRPFSRISLQ